MKAKPQEVDLSRAVEAVAFGRGGSNVFFVCMSNPLLSHRPPTWLRPMLQKRTRSKQ